MLFVRLSRTKPPRDRTIQASPKRQTRQDQSAGPLASRVANHAKKCDSCGFFRADNELTECPDCGHRLQFTMFAPPSLQAAACDANSAAFQQLELPSACESRRSVPASASTA